jgi:hypothetical protein
MLGSGLVGIIGIGLRPKRLNTDPGPVVPHAGNTPFQYQVAPLRFRPAIVQSYDEIGFRPAAARSSVAVMR